MTPASRVGKAATELTASGSPAALSSVGRLNAASKSATVRPVRRSGDDRAVGGQQRVVGGGGGDVELGARLHRATRGDLRQLRPGTRVGLEPASDVARLARRSEVSGVGGRRKSGRTGDRRRSVSFGGVGRTGCCDPTANIGKPYRIVLDSAFSSYAPYRPWLAKYSCLALRSASPSDTAPSSCAGEQRHQSLLQADADLVAVAVSGARDVRRTSGSHRGRRGRRRRRLPPTVASETASPEWHPIENTSRAPSGSVAASAAASDRSPLGGLERGVVGVGEDGRDRRRRRAGEVGDQLGAAPRRLVQRAR